MGVENKPGIARGGGARVGGGKERKKGAETGKTGTGGEGDSGRKNDYELQVVKIKKEKGMRDCAAKTGRTGGGPPKE